RLFGESGATIAARETFDRVVRATEGSPDLVLVRWSAALASAQLQALAPPPGRAVSQEPLALDEAVISALLEEARSGAPALILAIDVALAAGHVRAGRTVE